MEYPKFKVCCRCFTFNHSKYITDAMNGFTMQQTSFPFVCTIVDDASTDGEQDVIRKYVEDNFDFSEGSVAFHKETDYAHITYAQHTTNKNCYFAVLYLKENHYSQRKPKMGYLSEWRDGVEYEAMCEGDDYWISKYKLKKQIDILDRNKDVLLVYTNFLTVNSKGEEIIRPQYNVLKNKSKSGNNLRDLLLGNYIMTLTICYRVEILNDVLYNSPYMLDYSYFLNAALLGNFAYLEEITGAYRQNESSLMNTNLLDIKKKTKAIHDYYVLEYLKNFRNTQNGITKILLENEILINSILLYIKGYDRGLIKKVLILRPQLIINIPFAFVQGLYGKYVKKKYYLVGI